MPLLDRRRALKFKDEAVKVKDKALKVRRQYHERKQELFEQSVATLETKNNIWLPLGFVALVLILWVIGLFGPLRVEGLYNAFGFWPVAVVFFASYFAFFSISKVIYKPTVDELKDDTSYIALFSACDRRAQRGLISAAFGVLHTVVFFATLIILETGYLDVLK